MTDSADCLPATDLSGSPEACNIRASRGDAGIVRDRSARVPPLVFMALIRNYFLKIRRQCIPSTVVDRAIRLPQVNDEVAGG